MNVLEVVIGPYPEIRGGVDKMVSVLIDGLVARGARVTVLVPGTWAAATLRRREAHNIVIYERRLRMPFVQESMLRGFIGWLFEVPKTLRDLRRICARHGIEVIHVHTATNYVYWFRLLRLIGGPPYVITFHRGDVVDFPERSCVDRALIRWSLAGAAATNAVSRWLAEEARRRFPGLCDPVHIYNGMDRTARASGLRPAEDASALSAIPNEPYFVMVGTFDPYKGHDIAIRAWGLLPADDRPHLLIVGDGELRRTYLDLIDRLGCSAWIHMMGQLPNEDVQRIMRSSLGMIFPSRNEGFGYVILEAGLAGTAVLCSRIPPFDEIVTDGESGLLVPPEDPQALADAVRRLSVDPALRRRLGENLRRDVETRFSTEAMTEGYIELFEAVRDRRPVPR